MIILWIYFKSSVNHLNQFLIFVLQLSHKQSRVLTDMALFIYNNMSDNCKMRIQIDKGSILGIDTYGFHLAKSPTVFGCDLKESNFVVTDFPENDGDTVYIAPTPTKKSFEYPVSFLYFSDTLNSANLAITAFYESLIGKKITIYNDYKKVMVVGYAKTYKEGQFFRDEKDVVVFEIAFYVPRPQDCDFNLAAPVVAVPPIVAYTIGQLVDGGVVAYILKDGNTGYDPLIQKGLIADVADQLTSVKFSNNVTANAPDESVGSGLANTNLIIAANASAESGDGGMNYAARLCTNKGAGWYLPSYYEMLQLKLNQVAIGGFDSAATYWSSTTSGGFATECIFSSTSESSVIFGTLNKVRAIRSFINN